MMKGFTEINKLFACQAVVRYEKAIQEGKAIRKVGIERYYAEIFPTKSAFHRWRYRKLDAMDYCWKQLRNCFFWGDMSELIWPVLSNIELEKLKLYENCGDDTWKAKALMALANASESTYVYVGDDLAQFYNKWKEQ